MTSPYNEYGYCRTCGGIATGGIHSDDCPHSPAYVSPEERVEELEQHLETERQCRLANESQLHEADAEIGRLREQLAELSRIVRQAMACSPFIYSKLEDARPYLWGDKT